MQSNDQETLTKRHLEFLRNRGQGTPPAGANGFSRARGPVRVTVHQPKDNAQPAAPPPRARDEKKWACGIITVPQRAATLLPATLRSIMDAGFPPPRLFVDGLDPRLLPEWMERFPGLESVPRWPRVHVAVNWTLAMLELMMREPDADRYALFQDDVQMSRNARRYLDASGAIEAAERGKGYCNLHCMAGREREVQGSQVGFFQAETQGGYGALALVFTQASALALFSTKYLIERPRDPDRGWHCIDGGIVDAMRSVGWSEWVHHPSLTQHTGNQSTMAKSIAGIPVAKDDPPSTWEEWGRAIGMGRWDLAQSFRGEEFDCMSLLR